MKRPAITILVGAGGIVVAALLGFFVEDLASKPRVAHFDEIDVGRINLREPDGTLRLTLSNAAQSPGIVVRGREYPHPDRRSAGLLFFNDEGTENGGLIFDGRLVDGRPTSSGSLTFDRYEQDQVVQLTASEAGPERRSGLVVNDVPDQRLDFAAIARYAREPAAARDPSGLEAAHASTTRRVFVGRDVDRTAKVVLQDAQGRARLQLRVTDDGDARIDFLDERGNVVRSLGP